MAKVCVPSDVWALVLRHLKNPLPPIRSNPPRSALRQPDLCNAARVCRLFADLVDPLLYTEIATDDLYQLLSNKVETPSMIHRLSLTKKLYLEFRPKGKDPSYLSLLRNDNNGRDTWWRVGRTEEEVEKSVAREARREVFHLGIAIGNILGTKEMPRASIMPRLESIAIAALNGDSDQHWQRYTERRAAEEDIEGFDTVTNLFDLFLSRLPSLKHICTRYSDGPLALATMPPGPNPQITRTAHFGPNIGSLHLDPGCLVRLVSDVPSTENWSVLMTKLEARLAHLRWFRASEQMSETFGSRLIDAEIYCSTPIQTKLGADGIPEVGDNERLICTVKAQKKIAASLGNKVQAGFRKASGLPDVVRWMASADSPICQACGSGPPV